MKVTIDKKGDEIIIKVSGDIDTPSAEQLREEFNKIVGLSPKHVVLDMREVISIGSSGIGKIIYFHKHLKEIGGKVSLNVKQGLYEIFQSLRLDKIFPINQ